MRLYSLNIFGYNLKTWLLNITISNNALSASINTKGAELFSLKQDEREYMWEGNQQFWGKHSPVLFPIVGTLKNNRYFFNGKEYSMTRHGFARDNEFAVKHLNNNSVTFSFTSNEETRQQYPFDFRLVISYTLENNNLYISYTVSNLGSIDMPFSLGAHPAFALPANFEDYSLQFEKDEILWSTPLKDDLLTDHKINIPVVSGELPLSYTLFENDALIFKNTISKEITIKKNGNPFLKVSFNDFPHLGIWTKINAPFLCIEPWQGYSDSFNANGNLFDKEGIVVLRAGSTFRASLSIGII